MATIFFLFFIVFLGILAALLSASETAVTASSHLRLNRLSKEGSKKASILLSLREDMPTLISTILMANICLINGMSAVATEMFRSYLGPIGLIFAPLVMGVFTALYAEILPKIYVYQCPEMVAIRLVPLLEFLRKFLFPMTSLMDKIARFSLSIFNIKITPPQESTITIDDLRGAIDLHAGGGIVSHERAMLRSILDLSSVSVSEVMVHRKNIVSLNIETPFNQLCERMLAISYTRIPLWRDSPDNIVGVVHVKNLVKEMQSPSFNAQKLENIVREPWFIPETSTLFYQMQLFKERSVHQAFVVDEYGSLLGMVTLEDILEEIVGEIKDEHDLELPGVRLTPQGTYLVRGSVTLRDLRRQYDWDFGEMTVSTIAGLILDTCRSIPKVGDVIKIKDFQMKILRIHHHQLTLIEVTPSMAHIPS